ncbi:hypothetical protein [Pseudomonas coleopterorum]|uniref:hypothetical protein n=1 Tax=Pseudomonas coleopterorum TaxID=1605838 RepID=UPI000898247F|nr:hypothetical protein [Pseudomonas coleopterorum]SEE16790.1 hypothetical protein SAMN05216510_1679 [Pseudomonas coleopterorum]
MEGLLADGYAGRANRGSRRVRQSVCRSLICAITTTAPPRIGLARATLIVDAKHPNDGCEVTGI